ncbi:hypothetical protein KFE94_15310 [bacterium SCSIO 12643]|nr:hypothetical protein KFE94_15310 [bacterium SCSIO 12643]
MKIIKWISLAVMLITLNWFIIEGLLRVNGVYRIFIEAKLDKELQSADVILGCDSSMNKRLQNLNQDLKCDFDLFWDGKRIPYEDIERYNPYPPILHLMDSEYIIYKKGGRLRQITILTGESDATPSLLVKKARGEQTGFGDHFVTYIIYNDLEGNSYDYDAIDWYSWKGGSYDGFEELWQFPMLLFELLLIVGYVKWSGHKE